MARPGSFDSAAAIVAISAQTIEKMTTTMPEKIAPGPLGRNPPCAVRFEKSASRPGQSPITKRLPSARKMMIARTLMPANQYSNSPYDLTENRFVAVIRIISPRASNQSGASTQRVRSFAPATASKPTTMTQKYQYSQPTEKPAQPPRALRA
jgi:hypothetical protein